jgi:hypothetical protein
LIVSLAFHGLTKPDKLASDFYNFTVFTTSLCSSFIKQ